MRFELAGNLIHPDPIVITLTNGVPFAPQGYLNAGYTNFDVICIGAGGGMGGGINSENTGNQIRSSGGAGGGGGLHRVQGLLSALPMECPVVIGSGGSIGTEDIASPAFTTDGGDGGYSSFNTDTCKASGGKGGKRVQINSFTVTTQANGGDGGVGGQTAAGGGGKGGTPGVPSATGPGVAGKDALSGNWDGTIGQGGGGGAGGVAKFGSPPVTCNAGTAGGNGSYNPGDLTVYGPGTAQGVEAATGAASTMGGSGGGAKAAPVNRLPNVYGSSQSHMAPGNSGVVVIRLTAA
jgi:hypothetical protein